MKKKLIFFMALSFVLLLAVAMVNATPIMQGHTIAGFDISPPQSNELTNGGGSPDVLTAVAALSPGVTTRDAFCPIPRTMNGRSVPSPAAEIVASFDATFANEDGMKNKAESRASPTITMEARSAQIASNTQDIKNESAGTAGVQPEVCAANIWRARICNSDEVLGNRSFDYKVDRSHGSSAPNYAAIPNEGQLYPQPFA